ncbi:Yip1-like protein [Natrinema hispanicum]|uniref:Yip1-like protein n=1 Tax=Natrinema hispanicum TaxID=392421 RepID=A0A482Y1N4_9EURY|nr:YIP1 family protein [Natrinema hispanicum]RZV06110.1 Yip1-like protein [Natrinema hispanicum]
MPPFTLLFRPDRFFAERDFHTRRIIAVTLLFVFSHPIGVWGVSWILQERIDGTVMIDNPNRPSESFCKAAPGSIETGCDAPAQVDRNVDTLLSEATGQVIGLVFLGILIVIVLAACLLHAGSWVLGGEGGAATSFAVAIWGLVPILFNLLLGVGLLYMMVDPVTVTPDSNPTVWMDEFQADLKPLEQLKPLFTGITTLWSGIIWRFGLLHKRGLAPGEATGLAGSVALVFWLLTLI